MKPMPKEKPCPHCGQEMPEKSESHTQSKGIQMSLSLPDSPEFVSAIKSLLKAAVSPLDAKK